MSESESEKQNNLPYDRLQIYQQFKVPPPPGDPAYPEHLCYSFLKDEFDLIEQYGYDFSYTKDYEEEQHSYWETSIEKPRTLRRKVKLRFECESCPQKKWSSIVGTMEMKFKFQPLEEEEDDNYKFPYLLRFKLKIYRMKCINCLQFGTPLIYQSQLTAFARSVCITLADILEEVPAPVYKDKRHKMKEEIHNHLAIHCEACQMGRCFAKPKQ